MSSPFVELVGFKLKHFEMALKANALRAIFLSMITFLSRQHIFGKRAKFHKIGQKTQK